MTQSEQKWLLEQMASQRKRPASPSRSRDAEPRRPPEAAPSPAPTTVTALGEPSHGASRIVTPSGHPSSEALREEIPGSPEPPSRGDSFWSFG